MNADRWSLIRRLHAEVLEFPAAERRGFLERECGVDQILLEEIWELVSQEKEDAFLEAPVVEQVAPGVILGDFELLEEIGSGGTGIVFRARQKSLEREVALKIMPRHFALNERRVARFVREAKAAAKLEHPGIAPIYEVGCINDNHFIAMELVAGHDLARELELQLNGCGFCSSTDSVAQYREAARIVMQTADALAFAHQKGVVHRDVKPNNILLDAECRPRLVDFGLAKDESLGSITVADKVEGTPYYMSPEQARLVESKVDARTDIYSLGVVLYELLTRSRPFEGRTSQEVISKIIRREPRPVRTVAPSVPRDLAVICTKAMEKRPEQRYTTAKAMHDDLESFLAGEPILARPPGIARKVSRLVGRHRVAASSLAAAFMVLTLVGWANDYRERMGWPELHVNVLFADASVDPDTAKVVVRATPLHVFSGEPSGVSEPVSPESFRLPPGLWRIEVDAGELGFACLIRDIEPGRSVMPLRARIVFVENLVLETVLLDSFTLPRWAVAAVELVRPRENGRFALGPQGDIELSAFRVQTEEMSFGLFRRYLEESGDSQPKVWAELKIERAADALPVVFITRREARACAEWYGMRLPFEVELEYASRGPAWSRSPVWGGDSASAAGANTQKFDSVQGPGRSATFETFLMNAEPVDSRPEVATPTGLLNTLGNVMEMTESHAPLAGGSEASEGPAYDATSYIAYGGGFAIGKHIGIFPILEMVPRTQGLVGLDRGFRCVKLKHLAAADREEP